MKDNGLENIDEFFEFMGEQLNKINKNKIEFLPSSDLSNPIEGKRIIVCPSGTFGIGDYTNNRLGSGIYGLTLEQSLKKNKWS